MRFVARLLNVLGVAAGLAALAWPAVSSAADMRGVTATEIRIGQTMPYSGPVSAFGALGKGEVAYFRMLNEHGGINGRKVNLISLDDSYAPPKTVEQTRRLVESDEVTLIFSSIGTAHNTAIAKYLQSKNIPQLFVGSGASKFADIAQYPQATLGVRGRSVTRRGCMRAMRWRKIPTAQIRRDLAERRFRPRLSRGPQGRARREIQFDRHRRHL